MGLFPQSKATRVWSLHPSSAKV